MKITKGVLHHSCGSGKRLRFLSSYDNYFGEFGTVIAILFVIMFFEYEKRQPAQKHRVCGCELELQT